jgi:hypothetical protein
MRQKLARFDPTDRVVDQLAELGSLLLGDGGPEVLDLDKTLRTNTTWVPSAMPVIQE